MSKYHGWFGRTARKRCPHEVLVPIYGDQINMVGGWRLQCDDCYQYLDGPVELASLRRPEDALDEETNGD